MGWTRRLTRKPWKVYLQELLEDLSTLTYTFLKSRSTDQLQLRYSTRKLNFVASNKGFAKILWAQQP